MTFERPITMLVGENGSGKSTLVEAFAEAHGLDARGGRAGRKYGNARPKTPLGEALRLESTVEGARIRGGSRLKRKGFFLRTETASGLMETVSGLRGYWDEDTSEMSQGKGSSSCSRRCSTSLACRPWTSQRPPCPLRRACNLSDSCNDSENPEHRSSARRTRRSSRRRQGRRSSRSEMTESAEPNGKTSSWWSTGGDISRTRSRTYVTSTHER